MLGGQSKCGDGAHWGMECVWCQGALGGQGEDGVGVHAETRCIWGIGQGQGALEEWGMCEVGVHAETGCTGGMGQGWGAWGHGAHGGTGHMRDRGWGAYVLSVFRQRTQQGKALRLLHVWNILQIVESNASWGRITGGHIGQSPRGVCTGPGTILGQSGG